MTGSAPDNTSTQDALDKFEAWMLQYHEGSCDFEDFCAKHPHHEQRFRRWWKRLVDTAEVETADSVTGGDTDSRVEIDETTGLPEENSIFGSYRLERELGRGSQGTVYLATDTRLGRKVALKILPQWRMQRPSQARRFTREAELASKLDHPGLCGIYERGTLQGTAYLAMRYVEGDTLAARLANAKRKRTDAGQSSFGRALPLGDDTTAIEEPGSIQRVLELFISICDALATAHDANLVHRDIKPGNILVDSAQRPVLLDFGLARHIEEDELTMTGDLVGTPAYMSPEQIAAQRIDLDHRSDIYSLGATLYECLTLRRPFEAPTRTALYQQILAVEAPDARRFNSAISKDLAIVLATALEKDRNRRYGTARDFAEDLRRVLELEPIRARPAGAILRLRRWTQRNPATALSISVVFVALGAALIVSLLALAQADTAKKAVARLELRTILARARADAEALLDVGTGTERSLPARRNALEAWIRDQAEPLATAIPDITRRVEALQQRALPEKEAEITAFRAQHDLNRTKTRLEKELEGFRANLPRDDIHDLAREFLTRAVADHESRIRECDRQLASIRPWRMPTPAEQVAYEGLVSLRAELAEFTVEGGLLASVRRELDAVDRFSDWLRHETWRDVTSRLAKNERYETRALDPQFGLAPLGADARSGLEEFAVLDTGTPPKRMPSGELEIGPDSAIVLVLVPAAEYALGSRRLSGPQMEAMVRGIDLDRYFVSKFELTVAQWERLGGPSNEQDIPASQRLGLAISGPRHPVQSISWTVTRRALRRHALDIPTEAQWEYAARGRSITPLPWDLLDLRVAPANLRNRGSFLGMRRFSSIPYDDELFTAPVGSFMPNDFGLHDVIGNVAEWTRESYYPVVLSSFGREGGEGYFHVPRSDLRGVRGGSYESARNSVYLGQRSRRNEKLAWRAVGVRPIRRVENTK